MSRDYSIVESTPRGLRFRENSPTFNVNVWSVEYYGRIFRDLGLPTSPYSHTMPEIPGFLHEYTGANLIAVRKALEDPDFFPKLVIAVGNANHEMKYHDEAPDIIANDMVEDIFRLFRDLTAVAIASDYCEQYYEKEH